MAPELLAQTPSEALAQPVRATTSEREGAGRSSFKNLCSKNGQSLVARHPVHTDLAGCC